MHKSRDIRQLPLELPHRPALDRGDFLVSRANRAAIDIIDRWPDWETNNVVLIGPPGSGKSHLVAIWAARVGAPVIAARHLPETPPDAFPTARGLAIESIDDPEIDEKALFHVLNMAREHDVSLLMTSRMALTAWSPRLTDLASRLRAATPVELDEPDDDLLKSVLVKLFADRQLVVTAGLISYIVVRMERSLDAANRIVAEIDRRTLAEKRPVTRALAAAVLDAVLEEEEGAPLYEQE